MLPAPPPPNTTSTTTSDSEWTFVLHTPSPTIQTPSTSSTSSSKKSGTIKVFPKEAPPPPRLPDYPWNPYFQGFLPFIAVRDPISAIWYYKLVDHQDPPPSTTKKHCKKCKCKVNPHYHHLRCGKRVPPTPGSKSQSKRVSWDPCCKEETRKDPKYYCHRCWAIVGENAYTHWGIRTWSRDQHFSTMF
jgi:hypothetical protein